MLGMSFIGLSYLLVYVGATLIFLSILYIQLVNGQFWNRDGYGKPSVFLNWGFFRMMIRDVAHKETQEIIWEGDYSRLTSVLLAYYFHVTRNRYWVIAPEFNKREDVTPDYTIFLVALNPYNVFSHVVVEVKSKTGQSWAKLLEQMWTQADVNKYENGKLWAIGQKGLEICIFRFNVLQFQHTTPYHFVNFEPLNLGNLSREQLTNMGANCVVYFDNGIPRIGLIKWRLHNPNHWPYINHMFQVITVQQP